MAKRAPEVPAKRPPETRKIDAEQLDVLRAFKEESGMSIDEMLRTGIQDFIDVTIPSWRGWNATRVKNYHSDNFPPKPGRKK